MDIHKVKVEYTNINCVACSNRIAAGDSAIKVRENGKRAEYYHEKCYKKNK